MYLNVLESTEKDDFKKLKYQHSPLYHSPKIVQIEDMGAVQRTIERRLSTIASRASMPTKYGQMLYRLVSYFNPKTIIELGTCLGIGTSYLATASPTSAITTIEGSATLSEIAKSNFREWGLFNITSLKGHFDTVLPPLLASSPPIDMVFIDGNHRYEPTLRYFQLLMQYSHAGTILIFDDIYWSSEMTKAWTAIKADPRISVTIDLYRMGICFLRTDTLAKEDFVLRY